MQVRDLDNKEAPHTWWATQDARQRSYAASTHYTSAQKIQAERMVLVMDAVYTFKDVHVNYRQKFITIKVDHAQVLNAKLLKDLEAEWEKNGVVKRVSAQGVIYRIIKKD